MILNCTCYGVQAVWMCQGIRWKCLGREGQKGRLPEKGCLSHRRGGSWLWPQGTASGNRRVLFSVSGTLRCTTENTHRRHFVMAHIWSSSAGNTTFLTLPCRTPNDEQKNPPGLVETGRRFVWNRKEICSGTGSFKCRRRLENGLNACINWNCTQTPPEEVWVLRCLQPSCCAQSSTTLGLTLQCSSTVTRESPLPGTQRLILAGFCVWLVTSNTPHRACLH